MRSLSIARRVAPLLLIGLLPIGAAIACYGPTEVVVAVSTDLACSEQLRTAIYKGKRGALSPTAQTETTSCTPVPNADADIGSLVFIPNSDDDSPVGVKVVLARGGKSPADCEKNIADCVVASRSFSFVSHLSRRVPIRLLKDCIGTICPDGATCVAGGKCVSNEVTCGDEECALPEDAPPIAGIDGGPPILMEAGPDAQPDLRCTAPDGSHVLTTKLFSPPPPQHAAASPDAFYFIENIGGAAGGADPSGPRLVRMASDGVHVPVLEVGDGPVAVATTGPAGVVGHVGPASAGWVAGLAVQGTTKNIEVQVPSEIQSIAVAPDNGHRIYVSTTAGVYQLDPGTREPPLVKFTGEYIGTRIAVDESTVFISAAKAITMLARDTAKPLGTIEIVAQPPLSDRIGGVAFANHGAEVFVAGLDTSAKDAKTPVIARIEKAGVTWKVNPPIAPSSIAADATHVYFTDGQTISRVERVGAGTGSVAKIQMVHATNEPSGIDHLHVRGDCVYFWHTVSEGIVARGALEVWPKDSRKAQ